jgi:hypothetical protein
MEPMRSQRCPGEPRDRLGAVGGSLELDSERDRGMQVIAAVPRRRSSHARRAELFFASEGAND